MKTSVKISQNKLKTFTLPTEMICDQFTNLFKSSQNPNILNMRAQIILKCILYISLKGRGVTPPHMRPPNHLTQDGRDHQEFKKQSIETTN